METNWKCEVCGYNLIERKNDLICPNCDAIHEETLSGPKLIGRKTQSKHEEVTKTHHYRIRMVNNHIHDIKSRSDLASFGEEIFKTKCVHLVEANKVLSVSNIEAIWEI